MLYIGPGAGFAFLGSFLTMFLGLLASVGSILIWPFRMAWVTMRRKRKAQVRTGTRFKKAATVGRVHYAGRTIDARRFASREENLKLPASAFRLLRASTRRGFV